MGNSAVVNAKLYAAAKEGNREEVEALIKKHDANPNSDEARSKDDVRRLSGRFSALLSQQRDDSIAPLCFAHFSTRNHHWWPLPPGATKKRFKLFSN